MTIPPSMLTKITKYLPLTLILLLAFILRAYQLNSYPSLNPDEAALGYNAYSLIQTGRDEHGAVFPLHFKSFGDYKPGGYVYLAIPFVKVLGLTPIAVRLPNLILSLLCILFLYKLMLLITLDLPVLVRGRLSTFSALVLSLSPWHIHFSRGAWEASVALSLIVIGIYYFYKAILSSTRITLYLLLFTFFFSLSLSFYHSARVVAPAIIVGLIISNFNFFKTNIKSFVLIFIFGLIISTPVTVSFLRNGGTTRFGGVGITADKGPLSRSEELLNQHPNFNYLDRIIHNKRLLYTISWAQKYTSHFDPNFLFITGDEVPRSKVPEMGQLHLIEFPLLILGIYFLLKSRIKNLVPLTVILLLASPLASSLTFQAPSALRALPLAIPLTLLVSLGIYQLLIIIKSQKLLIIIFILLYSLSFLYYFDAYFNHYQKRYPPSWNYGFNQVVPLINSVRDKVTNIYFTDKYDQPYILYLFFSKYPPAQIQAQIKLSPPDQFGFSTVRLIDNIHFEPIAWDNIPTNSLVVASTEKIPNTPIKLINFPNDQPGFKIYIK